jgi:hypothetical protein
MSLELRVYLKPGVNIHESSTGWGKTRESEDRTSNFLQAARHKSTLSAGVYTNT